MLLELMKLNNITIDQLAKELGTTNQQIYKWNREGILESNPHYKQIKRRFPSIVPRSPTLTKKGVNDKRTQGRPKQQLQLTEYEHKHTTKTFRSEVFPKIIFKSPK